MLDLDAIRKRAEAATAGPWTKGGRLHDDWGVIRSADSWVVANARAGREMTDEEYNTCRRNGTDPYADNVEFIAACRQDIPALIAEVERLTLERTAAVELAVKAEVEIEKLISQGTVAHIRLARRDGEFISAEVARDEFLALAGGEGGGSDA